MRLRDGGAVLVLTVAGCATPRPVLPAGPAAYGVIPAPTSGAVADYRVGPLDELTITVFREAELSLERQRVDARR